MLGGEGGFRKSLFIYITFNMQSGSTKITKEAYFKNAYDLPML